MCDDDLVNGDAPLIRWRLRTHEPAGSKRHGWQRATTGMMYARYSNADQLTRRTKKIEMNSSTNKQTVKDNDKPSILEIIADPDKLRRLVELQLSEEERFGQPYDMQCLKQNLSDVLKDKRSGKGVQPKSCEEFVAAIVAEYRANLAAVVKAGCLSPTLTAYGVAVSEGGGQTP
jgi:hypothetical protein